MIIGGAALDIAWEDPAKNMEKIADIFDQAFKKHVELLVFPEMSLSGFSLNPEKTCTPYSDSFFDGLVRKTSIAAVYGHVEREESGYVNCASFLSTDLGPVTYGKRKLFTYADEHKSYVPGRQAISLIHQGIEISLNVCYDLRFPELFRENVPAELLVVIANWPSARARHWEVLLRARAVENQCFTLGVNRTGSDGKGVEYGGTKSMLIDHNGDEVEVEKVGELLIWELKDEAVERMRAWRRKFPALEDM
ncbi:MAG TPA: nitrilase-related carbon-nitrogen hydrolase [Mesotoga sp.]|nr:nitrilase [Mesotoga sp.]MDD4478360.1 nitrilase [Mesotoga sp.]HOI62825.1 nitrilase-related carbon-nitrogen hydrolase [Mesotoga sp.]HOY25679.1 nitrilase-related carbon-nitrogen hydrolase [Mesotoga sp.]HPM94239.1 nitrilase-related carbon-nitrogen hydrolase [Mesotoga sp.]